jgi:taurine dioxygenase
MGSLQIRRLGYALGAQVTGVDLTRRLSDSAIAEIRKAWLDHIVLCFPGQRLEAEQLSAFCERFGELDDNHGSLNRYPDRPDSVAMPAAAPVAQAARA